MTADGKLIAGTGKAYDSGRGGLFVCVSVFFYESDSFIFCFLKYFSFHLCFGLPQVSNCYESDSFIFIFALFLRCAGRRAAPFSVGLFVCVFVCVFSSFRAFLGSWRTRGGEGQRLMTADWGLITAAGEAYDSGRGADYRGGKGL